MLYVKTNARLRINMSMTANDKALNYQTDQVDALLEWLETNVSPARYCGALEIAGDDWVIRPGFKDHPYITNIHNAAPSLQYEEAGVYICFKDENHIIALKLSGLEILSPETGGYTNVEYWKHGSGSYHDRVLNHTGPLKRMIDVRKDY